MKPTMILAALACTLSCTLSISSAWGDESMQHAAERIAVTTCATCHGPQGRSFNPKYPVLADQHADYLVRQLQAFKSQTRGDADALGYMWGMAAPLDDAMMTALADYYSKQAPVTGRGGNAALIIHGKELYAHGNTSEDIPPCAACHGADANGTDMYPRLAGQHAQYLIKQLRSFQNNMRNVAVMHGVAEQLQLGEMQAVAAYLQSLP